MTLFDSRGDTPLAIGLLVGTAVMFAQPLRVVLSIAEDFSGRYRVDLIPGLMVFVIVLAHHYWRRHGDMRLEAERAVRAVEEANRTVGEMERLVTASRALAKSLDSATLQLEAARHIGAAAGDREAWIAEINHHEWRWIVEPHPARTTLLELVPSLLTLAETGERHHDGWALFPLRGLERVLGLLAVRAESPLTALESVRVETFASSFSVTLRNVHLFQELQVNSATDSLTGCFNRAHAFAALDSELRRSRRTRRPVSVLMLDVNDFKSVNDRYEHLCGDRLLESIGATLRRVLRASDIKSRYGGDEFLMVLPETTAEGAEVLASHIRRAVEEIEIQEGEHPLLCRVSIGVAQAHPGELDTHALVQRADEALYSEKQRGRTQSGASAPPPALPIGTVRLDEAGVA